MDTTPFTKRQRIVKGCVVGMVGLAVLFGSSTVSLAASKLRLGSRNCYCNCSTSANAGVGVLSWELKGNENCSITGKACTFNGVAGKVTQCSACVDIKVGNELKRNCSPASVTPDLGLTPGGKVVKPLAEQGDPVPNTSPFNKPGMNAPILRRGVEGESPATAPTGEEGTTTAPK
jgi:hypothetical protein